MRDTELVQQGLGFEIGNPDRRDPAVSDGPTVDDLDDRVGAHNTLIYDRVDTAVLGDNADVAEPRKIEHVRKTGKPLGHGRAPRRCACLPKEDN